MAKAHAKILPEGLEGGMFDLLSLLSKGLLHLPSLLGFEEHLCQRDELRAMARPAPQSAGHHQRTECAQRLRLLLFRSMDLVRRLRFSIGYGSLINPPNPEVTHKYPLAVMHIVSGPELRINLCLPLWLGSFSADGPYRYGTGMVWYGMVWYGFYESYWESSGSILRDWLQPYPSNGPQV